MHKPLKIGLNLLYMNRKLTGGSITYGINLVNELAKLDKVNNYIIYANKDCIDLPINIGPNFKVTIVPFHNKYVYIRYLWEQLIFPFYLLKDRLNIVHSLGYVGPLICPAKHIVSILDLNYKRHGESMNSMKRILLGTMVKLMSVFSRHIITISNFSKKEICDELKVSKNKVTVTHLSGSSDKFTEINHIAELLDIYKITSDYIISFGSTSSHKNIMGLLSAFSILTESNDNIKLTLVGHQHNNKELNDYIQKLNLSERVSFTGFVPDEHIYPLLKAAKLFIFPSFYEGFGIPLLDAQSIGVAVASSNAASLPEVGNDGALYFDPYDVKEMADVMRKLLENYDFSQDLIRKGLINRANFSWEKTARETLDCYKFNIIS